jgi:RNA polymerase sigma-70 factor (ECF subfamily)
MGFNFCFTESWFPPALLCHSCQCQLAAVTKRGFNEPRISPPMKDKMEANLIDRCRVGEAGAWDELFDRHYAPAYRFVFQLGYHLSHEDAEEICQETFLSVVRNLYTFKGGSAFQTWLFRIAANKARDFLERRSAVKRGSGEIPISLNAEDPETGLTLDPPAAGPSPAAMLAGHERLELVHEAVAQLDDACREIVELRYFGEFSYEELAVALELHPKTVSSRLSRCLDRLESVVKEVFDRENMEMFPV